MACTMLHSLLDINVRSVYHVLNCNVLLYGFVVAVVVVVIIVVVVVVIIITTMTIMPIRTLVRSLVCYSIYFIHDAER